MHKQLKIFSDKKWLPDNCNHTIMLYPFWGEIELPVKDPDFGRFNDYTTRGKEIFLMVDSIQNCDYAVLPFEYSFETDKIQLAKKIAKEVGSFGKKLIVFFNSDIMDNISLENTVIFRTSFFKSTQKKNEFALPGWSKDFFQGNFKDDFTIKKNPSPSISYCGYVDYLNTNQIGLKRRLKNTLFKIKKESFDYGAYIRGKLVRLLMNDKNIKTNFIIRDGFWAQGIIDKNEVRKEYIQNMLSSPYALVTRGAGNFSYRLYEVMSCGRIPVFINTDAVLPFENQINWKKQTIWVEEKNINGLGKSILDFHQKISEPDFIEMQKKNREIYEKYLSPVGFYTKMSELLLDYNIN